MRTDFHAGSEPLLHFHLAHERLAVRQIFGVPMIVPADGIADQIAGRRKAVSFEERQRLGERVGIAIIEREHDAIASCIAAEHGQSFPQRHAAQPEPADGPQLLIELFLIYVQQLEAVAVGTLPDIVVAKNRDLRHER